MAKPGRIFFPLDVNWYDDWGHLVSDDAALLWAVASCACKRMLKDGRLTVSQLRRHAPSSLVGSQTRFANAISELCNCDDAPVDWDGDSAIKFRGWSSWNDLAADVEAMSQGGAYGNHVRWHAKKGKVDPTCAFCNPSGSDILPESGPESKSREDTDTDTEKTLALSATQKPRERKRDELFEALVEVCEFDLKNLSRSERGRINSATKELRELGVCPEDIRTRAANYRSKWPGIDITPQGITGNWNLLEAGSKSVGSVVWGMI